MAPGFAAAGCEELNGSYLGVETREYSSDFSRLEFLGREGRARIALWPEGSAEPRRLDLNLDGKSHVGDGSYTGRRYRALCQTGALYVEAEFEGREEPFLSVFYREGEELRLVNALGDYARVTGRFLPER